MATAFFIAYALAEFPQGEHQLFNFGFDSTFCEQAHSSKSSQQKEFSALMCAYGVSPLLAPQLAALLAPSLPSKSFLES